MKFKYSLDIVKLNMTQMCRYFIYNLIKNRKRCEFCEFLINESVGLLLI